MTFKRLMATICVCALSIASMIAETKHILERGESLESIAKKYGVTTQQIIELNPEAASFTYIGMELTIPDSTQPVPPAPQSQPARLDIPASQQLRPNWQSKSTQSHNHTAADKPEKPIEESSQVTEQPAHNIFEYSFNLGWQCNISGAGGDFKTRSAYGLLYDMIFETNSNAGVGLYYSLFANYGLVDKDFADLSMCLGPSLGLSFNDKKTAGLIIPACCGYSYGGGGNVYFSAAPHFAFSFGKLRLNLGIIYNTNFDKANNTCIFISIGAS